MKKGIVFTMDAIVALYLFLIVSSAFFFLAEPALVNDETIMFQRLARDAYDTKWAAGELSLAQYKFNDACSNTARQIGAEIAVEYAGNGNLRLNIIKVCINE